MNSCKTCPNYITDQSEIRNKIRRPVTVPICGRYGYILKSQEQSEEDHTNVCEHFAENCDSFGILAPDGMITNPQVRVADPTEETIQNSVGTHVDSCHGCENLVKAGPVSAAFGWPLPLCRATGSLILQASVAPIHCGMGTPGRPSDDIIGVSLRRELRPGFVSHPDRAFKALVNHGNLSLEPTTYVSDSPVSIEDQKDGIRAWRKLLDPFGSGQTIELPIFDSSENGIFTAEERAEIPQTGGRHHPELYVDYSDLVWRFAVEEWMLNQTLYIQSEPGLGKTEFVYFLGWLMQLPVTRMFFTDKIEWDDIFGKMILRNGEMIWQDGRFTAATRRPGLILIDEPNMAPSEIASTFRTTSEADRVLYLDAGIVEFDDDGNQQRRTLRVDINTYCFIVWAGNPSWDPRNLGTKELAAADISRLTPAVLSYPPTIIEREIIRTTCLRLDGWEVPSELLDVVMRVSDDIREMSQNGEFPGTWGIRENVKVARKMRWYPIEEAYRMAVLNHYEPEVRAMVIEQSIKTIHDSTAKKRANSVV